MDLDGSLPFTEHVSNFLASKLVQRLSLVASSGGPTDSQKLLLAQTRNPLEWPEEGVVY